MQPPLRVVTLVVRLWEGERETWVAEAGGGMEKKSETRRMPRVGEAALV